MPFFEYNGIKITGIMSAVPRQKVLVDTFKEKFGEDYVEKYKQSTGVYEYRKSKKGQTASDLGFVAAEKLLNEKQIDRTQIGALVFASLSPDYKRPSTACVLHKRLQLEKNCAAFDLGLGCSAFVYGIQVMCSMMSNSDIRKGLLIVGETMSKLSGQEDRSSVMLFGDGGSAILFEKTTDDEKINVMLNTDGKGYQSIIVPGCGFRNPDPDREPLLWDDGNKRTLCNVYMNGIDVFSFAVTEVVDSIFSFMEKTKTTTADYDAFLMHQANKAIHKQIAKRLKIPMENMPLSLDRYGNTSAAAIPLTLSDCYGKKEENEIINVLMCGFGVGLSWGVAKLKIDLADVYEVLETDEIFHEGIINLPQDLA